ncbi:hypothetical protein [Natrialba sp. SSL1]|uniref:hypothetical protein n=1 Tax=Natrialba sp. SSL1 TaxID=1869245 RepID=UPI0008F8766C|nr:hypothetical protein [Natrialba sp. SSL1]OIB59259.1 hypothetical protein BBD46_00835 [Natrialba sp. SSL1]
MERNTRNTDEKRTVTLNRRGTLKSIGGALVAAAGSGLASGSVVASSVKDEPDISAREATRIARAKVETSSAREAYEEFSTGTVQSPELYYSLTGDDTDEAVLPTVYVFPVTTDGTHVGHITIGAQEWMPPVVEYGTEPAPHVHLDTITSSAPSSLSFEDTLLFQGPLSFGIEASTRDGDRESDAKFVDLERGFAQDLAATPRIEADPDNAYADGWDDLGESPSSSDVGSLEPAPEDSGSVSGSVPNWTDTGYSDWPGCSPIAAAMAVGYHLTSPNRTDLIDGLNDEMMTDSDGLTMPQFIPSGITAHSGMPAENHYIHRPTVATAAVDSDNPPLVSTMGDKEDGQEGVQPHDWDEPIGHTETIVAYEEDSQIIGTNLYLDTHNTWGGTRTLEVGDYLDTYMITTVGY